MVVAYVNIKHRSPHGHKPDSISRFRSLLGGMRIALHSGDVIRTMVVPLLMPTKAVRGHKMSILLKEKNSIVKSKFQSKKSKPKLRVIPVPLTPLSPLRCNGANVYRSV